MTTTAPARPAVRLPPTVDVERQKAEAARQEVRDHLALRSLYDFARQAWGLVDVHAFMPAWHAELICRELERVTRGETTELVVCIPPGHAKSLLVGVIWPAWTWLHRPSERTLSISNSKDLVKRDSWRTRLILRSPWYQRLADRAAILRGEIEPGGVSWRLAEDQDEKIDFANTRLGRRWCAPINGTITGQRGDGLIIDDPSDVKDVLLGDASTVARRMKEVTDIYDQVLSSRAERWRVVIMQRLHPDDLAGARLKAGARAVVLPAEGEPDRPDRHPDDHRAAGEPLFPALYARDDPSGDPVAGLARRRQNLGPHAAAAQLDQRPSAKAGTLILRSYLEQRYSGDPRRIPCDQVAISVDASVKKTQAGSYFVAAVWGRRGPNRYLLDMRRFRDNYGPQEQALVDLAAAWNPGLVLIEDKANGSVLLPRLRDRLRGVVAWQPRGDKVERVQLCLPVFQASQVWLPEASWAPWVGEWIEEHAAFPFAGHDDQVDTTSQILLYWSQTTGGAEAARNVAAVYNNLWGG